MPLDELLDFLDKKEELEANSHLYFEKYEFWDEEDEHEFIREMKEEYQLC